MLSTPLIYIFIYLYLLRDSGGGIGGGGEKVVVVVYLHQIQVERVLVRGRSVFTSSQMHRLISFIQFL